MPKGWSIALSEMPDICSDCLNIIKSLSEGPISMRWEDESFRAGHIHYWVLSGDSRGRYHVDAETRKQLDEQLREVRRKK
jgi:hypothetical protein